MMKNKKSARIILILHTHMPCLREADVENPVEETWLFEAIIDSYIPLVREFERLIRHNIPFKIVMSLSPTLLEMLEDEYWTRKFKEYFDRLKALAVCESKRTEGSECEDILKFYLNRLKEIETFLSGGESNRERRSSSAQWRGNSAQWRGNSSDDGKITLKPLLSVIKKMSSMGYIKLIPTAFTHAYLPIWRLYPETIKLQIEMGINRFVEFFGQYPEGFWLPECGYYKGLMEFLRRANIKWTVLEGSGIVFGEPPPSEGIFKPVVSPEGVIIFGRDAALCSTVWSRDYGYPVNPWYREFYRDICYELTDKDWRCFRQDGIRHHTGLKYYRITGNEQKMPYIREIACNQIELHAKDFLMKLKKRANQARAFTAEPVIVLAFDTELFGHWWFEGPEWLGRVIELIGYSENLKLSTPEDFSKKRLRCVSPIESSWGEGGFHRTWLREENSAYVRLIYQAIEKFYNYLPELLLSPLKRVKGKLSNPTVTFATKKAGSACSLSLLRELLMLQSSDFLFMLSKDHMSRAYAQRRLLGHLNRFEELLCKIKRGGTFSGASNSFSGASNSWLAPTQSS